MNKDIQNVAGEEVVITMPNIEALGRLDTMEKGFTLNTKYKSMEDWALLKDTPIRVYYMGLKEVPNEDGELITCGIFMGQDEVFLSAQMILVEAVKKLERETPLEIVYKGKKKNKTSNGTTMLFDVSILQ